MRVHRLGEASAIAMIAVLLSGCSAAAAPEPTSPPASRLAPWEVAKADAQRAELVVADLLETRAEQRIDQATTGVIERCNSRQHRWLGSTAIAIGGDTRADTVVDGLQERLVAEGWSVESDSDVMRNHRVIAVEPESGTRLLVTSDVDEGAVRISSTSACFDVSGDAPLGEGF